MTEDAEPTWNEAWKMCFKCRDYAHARKEILAPKLAAKAELASGERSIIEVIDEFMMAAHRRHVESGEPLRPGGPTRVTDPAVGRLNAMLAAVLEVPLPDFDE